MLGWRGKRTSWHETGPTGGPGRAGKRPSPANCRYRRARNHQRTPPPTANASSQEVVTTPTRIAAAEDATTTPPKRPIGGSWGKSEGGGCPRRHLPERLAGVQFHASATAPRKLWIGFRIVACAMAATTIQGLGFDLTQRPSFVPLRGRSRRMPWSKGIQRRPSSCSGRERPP